jgi:hypothetical protein
MIQQYVPQFQLPKRYEKHYYVSIPFVFEIGILLQGLGLKYYKTASDFLQEWLEKWRFEKSIDGKIKKESLVVQSPDKLIQINIANTIIQIEINKIPVIRETSWYNLITEVEKALAFPNKYFKVTAPIVKETIQLINESYTIPNLGIIYKAIMEA